MKVETVEIKASNEQGYVIINKSDLKKDQVLYSRAPANESKVKTKQKKKLLADQVT